MSENDDKIIDDLAILIAKKIDETCQGYDASVVLNALYFNLMEYYMHIWERVGNEMLPMLNGFDVAKSQLLHMINHKGKLH